MKSKPLFFLVLIISAYHLFGIIGSLLANGSFIFNIQRNDSGIVNIVLLINIVIAIFYIILLLNENAKIGIINHFYFATLLLAYLTPYITYYLSLPSNDYARIGGILFVPLILIGWFFSVRHIRKIG